MENELIINSRVDSQVVLIGLDWDLHGEDKSGWEIRYYGAANDSRVAQFEDCMDRASITCRPQLAVRLPDGSWIVGAINT